LAESLGDDGAFTCGQNTHGVSHALPHNGSIG
jgi:hypothetical protein